MKAKLKNQLQTLSNILKKNKNIYGVCVVGSSTMSEDYFDIDLLIIGKNKSKIIEYIVEEFKKYNPYINDDSVRVCGYLEKELGFAVYEYNQMLKDISKYINGIDIIPQYKNWNIVGWLPECLFYDLKNMIITYEQDRKMSKIRNMVATYPQKFKSAIIESCNDKIKNLSKRIGKAKEIEQQIIEAEIKSLSIRKKFAEKETYFKGFKNIDKQIEELR